MRPRVKSYGESSTATLSPARMRIKFLRILPETCARTWCLFSSSTRNMALGNGSMTVAITSMASSFGFPESPLSLFFSTPSAIFSFTLPGRAQACLQPGALQNQLPGRAGHLFRARQNPRPVGSDGHGMLEVRRRAAIRSFRDPLVPHPHFRAAGIDHGLDGDDHAFLQPRAASFLAVIRKVGLVMHPGADAVPDKLPHHRETVLLDPALHGMADVAEAVASAHLVNRAVVRLAGHIQHLLSLRPHLPQSDRHRGVRIITVHFHPEIDRDDIAFAQLALGRRNP